MSSYAGTKITGEARNCIVQALQQGGIDHEITRERLVTMPHPEGKGVRRTIIPGKVALFQDDTYLATVGSDYQVVPNRKAFLPLDPLAASGQYEVDLVGEFRGGRQAFVLLERCDDAVLDVANGDTITDYALFSTSHDGHGALRGGFIPFRPACSNMISGAMARNGVVSLAHNKKLKERMGDLAAFIKQAPALFQARCNEFQCLQKSLAGREAASEYLTTLKAPLRVSKAILDAHKDLKTWWHLYNAYNSYLCHDSSPKTASRTHSLWFGSGAKKDKRALQLALELCA